MVWMEKNLRLGKQIFYEAILLLIVQVAIKATDDNVQLCSTYLNFQADCKIHSYVCLTFFGNRFDCCFPDLFTPHQFYKSGDHQTLPQWRVAQRPDEGQDCFAAFKNGPDLAQSFLAPSQQRDSIFLLLKLTAGKITRAQLYRFVT